LDDLLFWDLADDDLVVFCQAFRIRSTAESENFLYLELIDGVSSLDSSCLVGADRVAGNDLGSNKPVFGFTPVCVDGFGPAKMSLWFERVLLGISQFLTF
jgi:hypothetical protein